MHDLLVAVAKPFITSRRDTRGKTIDTSSLTWYNHESASIGNPKRMSFDWSKYTDKQKAAIRGYLKHGNKLKAYREAYDVSNQTDGTTKRNTYSFFSLPKIAAVIERVQEEAIRISDVSIDDLIGESVSKIVKDRAEEFHLGVDSYWVLRRAALLADFNINKFLKVDGHGNAVYDFSDATDDDWYCIQEYTVEEISRGKNDDTYFVDKIKIKSHEKLKALELVRDMIKVENEGGRGEGIDADDDEMEVTITVKPARADVVITSGNENYRGQA